MKHQKIDNYMKINNLAKHQLSQYQGVNATGRKGVCEQLQKCLQAVVKAFVSSHKDVCEQS